MMIGEFKKIAILLLFALILPLCLFAATPSFEYRDTMKFQMDIVISNAFTADLYVVSMSDGVTPISEKVLEFDESYMESPTPLGICRVIYESNIPGANVINLKLNPFVHTQDSSDRVGYTISMEKHVGSVENEYSYEEYEISANASDLEIDTALRIPFYDSAELYSSYIDLFATLTDSDQMSAGSYRTTIVVGVEGK